jgi:hypothetical protein
MKNGKIIALLLPILIMSTMLTATASASLPSNNWPKLPTSPVTFQITSATRPAGITLSNIPLGYDISNGVYVGYCAELEVPISLSQYSCILVSSLDQPSPSLWNQINYILNHKEGTGIDVQVAIWLTMGSTASQILAHHPDWTISAAALSMYNNAKTFGVCFKPESGQIVAIICQIPGAQTLFIELRMPGKFSGLTPGFWKNHIELWSDYYKTSDKFNEIFGVSITIDGNKNPTLLQALSAKGGINENKGVYDALARHAVAALLNANNQYINYPLNTFAIIKLVQDAITKGGAEQAKNTLEAFNSLEGGIDAHGNPI